VLGGFGSKIGGPGRFDEIASLVRAEGWSLSRRSVWMDGRPSQADEQADVWLGDSVGEMPAYYAAASLGLLGGSFEPLGGQNLIEAAACGCPMILGPSTFNFAAAADQAVRDGAAIRCESMDAAVASALRLLEDERRIKAMSAAGRRLNEVSQGAAGRQAQSILLCLGPVAVGSDRR
jgi:3-deoxy-D-manno-octulosonic-acid transferase